MLGQGDRGGGGPAGHAAEVNAGPAWFPSHPQGAAERRIILKTAPDGNCPRSPRVQTVRNSQGGGSDDSDEFHRPLKENHDAVNPQPVKGFLPPRPSPTPLH